MIDVGTCDVCHFPLLVGEAEQHPGICQLCHEREQAQWLPQAARRDQAALEEDDA